MCQGFLQAKLNDFIALSSIKRKSFQAVCVQHVDILIGIAQPQSSVFASMYTPSHHHRCPNKTLLLYKHSITINDIASCHTHP